MATLTRILDQHLDNASSLIEIRCKRVLFSGVRLSELESIDRKIVANLEGIMLSGRDGQAAAMNALAEWNSGAELFVCTMLCAMEEGLPFSSALDHMNQNNAWGFAEAFCWLSQAARNKWCEYLGGTSDPLSRLILNYCKSFTTNEQNELADLDSLLTLDQRLRLPIGNSKALALQSEKHSLEFAALSNPGASTFESLLNKATSTSGNEQRIAALFLASVSPAVQGDRLISALVTDESLWRLATLCIGIVGDVRYVPWLLDRMSSRDIGKEAGEAFCMITGAHPIYHQLVAEDFPVESQPEAENDEANESLETDFGVGLDYLDAVRARSRWEQFKSQAGATAGRYLLGKPKAAQSQMDCLKCGDQWQRRSSALALFSNGTTQTLFDVSAPYFVQSEILSATER